MVKIIDDQPISASFFKEGKWLKEFITPGNLEVQEAALAVAGNLDDIDAKVRACQQYVGSFKYKPLISGYVNIAGHVDTSQDLWLEPGMTCRIGVGNCLAGDTKVLTINPQGDYEIVKIKDLSSYKGYCVLSYNKDTRKIEQKPIINWFDNGLKGTIKVRFNNGEYFCATRDHKLFQEIGPDIKEISLSEVIANKAPSIVMICRLLLIEYKNPSYHQGGNSFDIGLLKVKKIEGYSQEHVYDIEVADNHNFILANGLLVHNCANKSFLLTSMLRTFLGPEQVKCVLGNLYNGHAAGHAWVQVNLGQELVVEATRPDVPPVPAATATRYEAVHLFNDQIVEAIEGRTVLVPFSACYSDWLRDYLNWNYINGA